MKFETVGIHFLSDVFGLLSSGILPPWQCDVATSPSLRDPFKGTPLIFFSLSEVRLPADRLFEWRLMYFFGSFKNLSLRLQRTMDWRIL